MIYAVAPSFKEPNTIWAGTDDGLIHITRDAGKILAERHAAAELTPWSKVSVIEAATPMPAPLMRRSILSAWMTCARIFIAPAISENLGRRSPKDCPAMPPTNVVREDPARKGLLFAGSETSVYVSFNDGDDWQPLQLNLPHTSMRDLAIHGDDLIVGTHGRSFWILDDITPLRQWTAENPQAPAHLFAPQTAVRFRWNRNTDTPLPPEIPAGQNPPDGAIIDYSLAAASAGEVKLEIFDAQNRLVRSYTSSDKSKSMEKIAAENPIPMYWVRPQQILSAAAGLSPVRLGFALPGSRRAGSRISDLCHLPQHTGIAARRLCHARHLYRQADRGRTDLYPVPHAKDGSAHQVFRS